LGFRLDVFDSGFLNPPAVRQQKQAGTTKQQYSGGQALIDHWPFDYFTSTIPGLRYVVGACGAEEPLIERPLQYRANTK
jgi:hypothetical protein